MSGGPDEAAMGRYVLLERIGVGGMAEVFRAMARGAEGFERPIAIKRILAHLAEDSDFVQMFVDEAKIAVQLQHPNIVQIFDLGRDDLEYFIAMEYVHGKDLRVVQDGLAKMGQRMPLSVAVHVAMKTCEALHHAHFATGHSGEPLGVVHRDVTPQNVLVSYDGEVKVTDFGLARAAGRSTQTQAGVVKGKLAYMAPEAFSGLSVDLRGDVYGVGVVLWEMLTGHRLFLANSDLETVERARAGRVPSLRSLDPGIPDELDRIVLRALARDREQRYQTAEELHDELEAFAYSHQQFLTTGALAGWLRDRFPIAEPPRQRGPGGATREIRLANVAAQRPETMPPSEMEELFEEDPSFEEDDALAAEEALAAAAALEDDDELPDALDEDDAGEALDDDSALADDDAFAEDALADAAVDAALAADDAASAADYLRDTVQPPPPDAFDDTTGKMAPRVIEFPTEQRYDRDLAAITVQRAPAAPSPAAGLGWDDGEDLTQVVVPERKRPT